MILLTETKCKIRFIYVRFNFKRRKWGKKLMEISAIKGGGFDAEWQMSLKISFLFLNTFLRAAASQVLFLVGQG